MPVRADKQRMRKVTVRFTEEQYNKLKRMAAQRGTSMSQVIRDALDLLLRREGYKPDT